MSKLIINGGKKLSGEIRVSGSKNAVLALIPAALLSVEKSVLTNVPDIRDVETMIALIADLGVKAEYDKSNKRLTLDPSGLNQYKISPELASKLRASILLVGPLLGRLRQAELPTSGGDKIGVRTIQPHVLSLQQLGVKVSDGNGFIFNAEQGMTGSKIIMEETSVTATENLLMAAALAHGTTIIKLAAMEPHVQQVAEFLNKMGAKITGIGMPVLTIEGVSALHGAEIAVIPDSNQAATFITLAAAAKSHVKVSGINPDFLDDFLLKMKLFGVNFKVGSDYVEVFEPQTEYKAIGKLQVGLYPKLASDDVPPMAVLATQAVGETTIYEWLYENRLSYVPELNKMGAKTEILDPHRVKIKGSTKLSGNKLVCTDIRMGMALVIAALVADGESEVDKVGHIARGYENLDETLKNIGADIKRIDYKK